MSKKKETDFYISYVRADRAWAEWIAWCLEEVGYKTTLDLWHFRPGSNLILEINKAVTQAKRTIAVLSPDYITGSDTEAQWAAALARDPESIEGKLLPVLVRECAVEGLLAQIVPIDLTDLNEPTAKKVLVDKIKEQSGAGEGLPPKPPLYPASEKSLAPSHLGFPRLSPLMNDYIEPRADDNVVAELFKEGFQSFRDAKKWVENESLSKNFLGEASRRYTKQLEERYNTMRIFAMSQPISLRSIYTRVNVLEKITSAHSISIKDLEQFFDFDRRSFGKAQKTEDGIHTINRLERCIVLGKPGAGKTTFLKYIMLQALDGELAEKRIPILIGLKDWSDTGQSLKDFLIAQFDVCEFPDTRAFIERLLRSGSCLVLFDGLDEVSTDVGQVIKEILDFSFLYRANKFLISCRIAAYNHSFEQFTDIELADFSDAQIRSFIFNWFGDDARTAEICWDKLQENYSIKELASIPLLLAMLCVAFEENLDFPSNKTTLYKDAIDALLKKWDTSRRIKREEVYKKFSINRKEAMFSQLAAMTFKDSQYFLPQRTLVKHIVDFTKHLHESDPHELEPDGEAILKSIEAQHGLFVERAKGIYSFSHLTFQEYFTAKYLVDNAAEGTLEELVKKHLADARWSEVFRNVAGMLPRGDKYLLLMKEQIDALVDTDSAKILRSMQDAVSRNRAALSKMQMPLGVARMYILYCAMEHMQRDLSYNVARDTSLDHIHSLTHGICVTLFNILRRNYPVIGDEALNAELNLTFALDETTSESFLLYIKAVQLLVNCLNSECYVLSDTRTRLLDELLVVPPSPPSGPSAKRRLLGRFWKS
jgi:hypothetical protein